MSTDNDEDRHILDGQLIRQFDPRGRGGRVRRVEDLAVERLDLVVCWGHLIDEDLLHSRPVCYGVPVE